MEILATSSEPTPETTKPIMTNLVLALLLAIFAQSCDDGRIEPFEIPYEKDNPLIWRAPIKADSTTAVVGLIYNNNDKLVLLENTSPLGRHIHCYSAKDGEILWEWNDFDIMDRDPYINFAFGTGFCGNLFYAKTSCFDYVIDANTGQLVWKYYNSHSNKTALISGSTLYRTRIYNDIPFNDSVELWETDLSEQNWKHIVTFHKDGKYKVELGTLTIDPYIFPDTILYFHVAYNDFKLHEAKFDFYAWNKSTRSMIWRQQNIGQSDAVNVYESVVDEEKVYFHIGNAIYAFDKFTGEPQWKNELSSYALSANWLKIGDVIITLTSLGELNGIKSTTGKTYWRSTQHFPSQLVPFRDGFIFTSSNLKFTNIYGHINQADLIFELDGSYNYFKTITNPPCVDAAHERIFLHDHEFIYCYDPDKFKKY